MARQGYIKLYRSIKKNFLWKDKPFTKGQAWTDILLEANHADGGFYKRGVWVEVKRGQDGRAELTLADEWGWSRGKVRRFLATLKNEQMIELKQDNRTTIITICNYELYQGSDCGSDTSNSTADGTPNGHQTDTKRYTNNNVKNDKKNKKTTYSENSGEFRVASYLFKHIRKRKPDYKQPDLQKWSEHADKMIRIDKRPIEQIRGVIKWCQLDEFWQNNILSVAKLRKQYDQLVLKMESSKKSNNNSSKDETNAYLEKLKHKNDD